MPGLYGEVAQDMHVVDFYTYLAVAEDNIVIVVADRRPLLPLIGLHMVNIEDKSFLAATARRAKLLSTESTNYGSVFKQNQE